MSVTQSVSGADRRHTIGVLRVGFGLIWCINLWFHLRPSYLNHYLDAFHSAMQNGPLWLHPWLADVIALFQAVGPHTVAVISVAIEVFIALSLLTGWLGKAGGILGLVYSLFLFSTVGTLGAPFATGYTDPGPWPPYIIAFIFMLETRAWLGFRAAPRGDEADPSNDNAADSASVTLVLFGLLWAFEAYWKWHPYFIRHFLDFLKPAVKGQPAWIAAYINAVIVVIGAIGAPLFGVFTAVVETLIAIGLLTRVALRFALPLGALWSLGIWTTAEGWGGPYGAGFSSSPMPGDIFANGINYALVFLMLMAVYGGLKGAPLRD